MGSTSTLQRMQIAPHLDSIATGGAPATVSAGWRVSVAVSMVVRTVRPNTHFYSASDTECNWLKGVSFSPTKGKPSGSTPLPLPANAPAARNPAARPDQNRSTASTTTPAHRASNE